MTVYWLTKEREHILPRDMEDSHIINCIKMVAKTTNNPLVTGDDWRELATNTAPAMPYILYEAYARKLLKAFNDSLEDWAWGIDDAYDDIEYPGFPLEL